jgi:Ni/Fe-hydrogenase subunit HybB-like protein
MSAQQHAAPAPVGGSLFNATTLVCGVLIAVMATIIVVRLFFGLASTTNVNDGYSWGIWVVVDVFIGSALACGGFCMALLVYIFNKGKYHPLVRPALLGSLFGYTLAGAAITFDLGRWWNFWHIFWPGYFNVNSVMFEVAACITLYIIVMWIEFSPVFLEKLGLRDARRQLEKVLYIFIALGVVLPMMHQASLGTMLVVMGGQVHPLWQTPVLPLLYLLSAITLGYGVILFESCVAASAYRRQVEVPPPQSDGPGHARYHGRLSGRAVRRHPLARGDWRGIQADLHRAHLLGREWLPDRSFPPDWHDRGAAQSGQAVSRRHRRHAQRHPAAPQWLPDHF